MGVMSPPARVAYGGKIYFCIILYHFGPARRCVLRQAQDERDVKSQDKKVADGGKILFPQQFPTLLPVSVWMGPGWFGGIGLL